MWDPHFYCMLTWHQSACWAWRETFSGLYWSVSSYLRTIMKHSMSLRTILLHAREYKDRGCNYLQPTPELARISLTGGWGHVQTRGRRRPSVGPRCGSTREAWPPTPWAAAPSWLSLLPSSMPPQSSSWSRDRSRGWRDRLEIIVSIVLVVAGDV